MRVLHLGGGPLGDRVLGWLRERETTVDTVTDLAGLDALTPRGYDWFVSAGFRHIIPEQFLDQVPRALNVHTSFLPWGRGAHPNVWAIVDEEPAGVSIHAMTAGLDRGPIYAQQRVEVTFGDVASDLHRRLNDAAFDLFTATWPRIRDGSMEPTPQPDGGSYHSIRDLQDLSDIDLDAPTTWRRAFNTLRGLTFPPYRNLVVESRGRQYHVEIRVTEIHDE